MGFEQKEAVPLWREYRDQFPVTERLIYLNHAAVAPLPRPCAAAMREFAQDAQDFGSLHYDKWMDTYERLRVAAARLIGADRGEIALVKNTSEGIATVAMGLTWHPGDRVVAFREEFPSNYYPWLRLESERCSIEWLSVEDPLERIDNACGRRQKRPPWSRNRTRTKAEARDVNERPFRSRRLELLPQRGSNSS